MGKYRSFTVRPPKPSFTKRSIELWTAQLISHFGSRTERRDEASDYMEVSRRTIDAWCSASDPRVISAEMLMELAIGATLCNGSILKADEIYDVLDGDETIGTFRDVGYAAYVADLRGYTVVRRDGRPVQMTEEQQLRSRLRKILASGQLTLKKMSEIVGGDEYAVVDRIVEVRERLHKPLYHFTLDRVELHVRRQTHGDWPMGPGRRSMKRSIPLTGTTTSVTVISPERKRFLASLNRQMERTLASGKIKIRPHGQRQTMSAEPKLEPAQVPFTKAPEVRRGPPPRPAFKRPSAISK